MTNMSSTGGMLSGSVPETPMTPGPKATMASPPEYRPSAAAGTPMPAYGQPGYSSTSFNQTLGKASSVGPPVGPPMGPSVAAPVGGTAVLPLQTLRVSIRDESGQPQVIPVSPTAHAQNARLHPDYQNEFGSGMVRIGAHMHRRLPSHFLN